MIGLVVKNTGSGYWVKNDSDGQLYECKIKGNFRIKGIKSTNPVAVGDRVSFDMPASGIGWIHGIEDRKIFPKQRLVHHETGRFDPVQQSFDHLNSSTQGRPYWLSFSMKGAGSNCSML